MKRLSDSLVVHPITVVGSFPSPPPQTCENKLYITEDPYFHYYYVIMFLVFLPTLALIKPNHILVLSHPHAQSQPILRYRTLPMRISHPLFNKWYQSTDICQIGV